MAQLRNHASRSDDGPEPNRDAPEAGSGANERANEEAESAPPDTGIRSTAEKITTAISVLLIVALAGAILYEGYATGQADPARLEVTVLEAEIEQRGDAFYIPFEVLNDGDQTVEEVTVSIEVLDGEEVVDEAETVIATLGEAETITAMLVVADDPTGLTIKAGVVTYQIAED